MVYFIWLIIAYLFGSINNGILISKVFYKDDIRNHGSSNAGSTNMLRTYGVKPALAVFFLDIVKPIIPIVLCTILTPQSYINIIGGVSWIGVAAIIGQCFPIFFKFKGGKGAASTWGCMLILFPLTVPGAACLFFLLMFLFKRVSLAILLVFAINTIAVYFLYPQYILTYIVIACLVYWLHRSNIKRLLNGTEPKISRAKF